MRRPHDAILYGTLGTEMQRIDEAIGTPKKSFDDDEMIQDAPQEQNDDDDVTEVAAEKDDGEVGTEDEATDRWW